MYHPDTGSSFKMKWFRRVSMRPAFCMRESSAESALRSTPRNDTGGRFRFIIPMQMQGFRRSL